MAIFSLMHIITDKLSKHFIYHMCIQYIFINMYLKLCSFLYSLFKDDLNISPKVSALCRVVYNNLFAKMYLELGEVSWLSSHLIDNLTNTPLLNRALQRSL